MAESASTDTRHIVWLADLDRRSLAIAGGKATNLGELMRAGLPVPQGFCVTTAAYSLVADAAGLDELVTELAEIRTEDTGPLAHLARRIREKLLAVDVPAPIGDAVAGAYRALAGNRAGAVAVRSSATAEDLPTASFAGQQDTYLNVVDVDAVLDAVRRCWASLWTDRAVSYRASNRIDHHGVRLAVVIQAMVDASVAGVMFTANPLTGRRRQVVIDASPGLGEAVVSGAVNPDHFVVDGVTGEILERRLGDKRVTVRTRAGGGTERLELATGNDMACLADDQIRSLAALGVRVEEHYAAPQDIEFAVDAEGKIWLTQARPITTLFPLPSSAPTTDDDLRVYFSLNVFQGVFRPFTPMGMQVFRLVGSAIAGLFVGPARDPLAGPSLLVEAGLRLFLDITPLVRSPAGRRLLASAAAQGEARSGPIVGELAADPRLAPLPTRRWRLAYTVAPAIVRTRLPLRIARAILSPASARASAGRTAVNSLRLGELPPDASSEERLAAIEHMFLVGMPRVFPRYMPVMAAGFLTYGLAGRLLGKLATPQELALVRRGLPHNPTTEMDLALWARARRVHADAAAERAVRGSAPRELARHYVAGKLPGPLQDGLDEFLRVYGHRAVAEIDVGLPRWSEDPIHIFGVLANYLQLDDPARAPDLQFRAARAQASATVAELARRAAGRGWLRGVLVRFLLGRCRELLGVRERPKFYFVQLLARARALLGSIGVELARGGRLDAADDVYFLTIPELRSACQGAELRALVAERRASYERELQRRRVPRILLSDGTEPTAESSSTADSSGATLRGAPASPGVVAAKARVILDPTGARLEPGEILVAPSTDPGWTPLFLTAGGLVMEMGGPMSHGAVVAREYGIPAVVGVEGAVERITTGDQITVDGAAGVVRMENEERRLKNG